MSSSCHLQCLSFLENCKSLAHLKQIHAHASKLGFDADPFIAGKLLLLSATALADSLDYARRLFSQIPSPDAFMYNTLIRGISGSDHPRHALLIYSQMQANSVSPDSFSFAFLLKAAANSRSLISGTQLQSQAIHHGFDTHLFVGTTLVSFYAECGLPGFARRAFDEIPHPNVVAWNAVVTACFRCDDVRGAEELFHQMPLRNVTSWNLMLAGYTKTGELESARKMFSEMPDRDPVSWSTMISGFSTQGRFDDAFGFFRSLLAEGGRPNEVSLTGILSACAQAGAFESGRILHGHIEKAGLAYIVSVGNALVDMYARCGNVEMARRVFDWAMGRKSVISWTSMVAALAMHGLGEEAIEVFCEMEESGTRPDGVTFISVLYACSHAGLIEQGDMVFCRMVDVYRIEPSIEHYGCMVDLYGRAGLLDKAYEFAIQMPIRPNAIIWRTLLGACSIHGNVGLGEHVRRRLLELDPNDSGDYVLLSNIYAVAGKWKDVSSVRRSMREHGIKKDPGWSSIEVDKAVYGFVAGDESTSFKREAHEKLNEIMSRLRLEGYIPEVASVLHDIEEEEKHESISRHSEKLAVAFGLARMGGGSVIRIVKNLRVCRDCHTVMKLISKVYQREIVVRDRSRFHYFREGSCSCRDYW